MEKGDKTIHKTIFVDTNLSEMEDKINRLKEIIEEASALIKELASMNIELEIDL